MVLSFLSTTILASPRSVSTAKILVLEAAADFVQTRYLLGVLCSGGERRIIRDRKREVAIEKFLKQNLARAHVIPAGTVVGNKESNICIGDQVQIAMKIFRVTGMPDDAMAIARFFVKAQSLRVHGGRPAILSGVHLYGGFRF